MILSLGLVPLGKQMEQAQLHRICVQPGDAVRPGSALAELRVELGASMIQDCPPIFYYRLVATERAIVRRVEVKPGEWLRAGAPLLLLASTADESLEGAPARALRCTAITIQVDPFAT